MPANFKSKKPATPYPPVTRVSLTIDFISCPLARNTKLKVYYKRWSGDQTQATISGGKIIETPAPEVRGCRTLALTGGGNCFVIIGIPAADQKVSSLSGVGQQRITESPR